MFNLLGGMRAYLKRQDVVTDNPIFRIHCSFTTVMLLSFSMVITWTQFVGQPIRCIVGPAVPTHVINTYCWIMTTYTMPDAFSRPSSGMAHPGVVNDRREELNKKYYTYYQWVCFVLFFQAMMCYFPKWLWDTWERGLMKTVIFGLHMELRSEEENEAKRSVFIAYLTRHLSQHVGYTWRYWFCELLCMFNMISQLFIMNWFMNGDFITYGWDVLTFDNTAQKDRVDSMIFIFPRVTKCTFRTFGPSNTIQVHDAMCILPLNIVNEKTYVFLWFWYVIMSILTTLVVCFRLMVVFFPRTRPLLMQARNRMLNKDCIEKLSTKLSVGDWWLIYMVGRNIDPRMYKDLIEEFGKKSGLTLETPT